MLSFVSSTSQFLRLRKHTPHIPPSASSTSTVTTKHSTIMALFGKETEAVMGLEDSRMLSFPLFLSVLPTVCLLNYSYIYCLCFCLTALRGHTGAQKNQTLNNISQSTSMLEYNLKFSLLLCGFIGSLLAPCLFPLARGVGSSH